MPKWSDVPEDAQRDLLEWFNCSKPDAADKKRLASMYFNGRFHAWNCINCGDRCYYGDPDDWSHFQGVLQLDFTSYPGCDSKPDRIVRMCDHCRMYDIKHEAELDLTGIGEPFFWTTADEEANL